MVYWNLEVDAFMAAAILKLMTSTSNCLKRTIQSIAKTLFYLIKFTFEAGGCNFYGSYRKYMSQCMSQTEQNCLISQMMRIANPRSCPRGTVLREGCASYILVREYILLEF